MILVQMLEELYKTFMGKYIKNNKHLVCVCMNT